MTLIWSLAISLALTELIELLLALLFKKRGRDLAVVALVNLLTNPPLVFLWQIGGKSLWVLLPLEILAFLTEGFFYRKCTDFKSPFRFALICNLISFLIGELL